MGFYKYFAGSASRGLVICSAEVVDMKKRIHKSLHYLSCDVWLYDVHRLRGLWSWQILKTTAFGRYMKVSTNHTIMPVCPVMFSYLSVIGDNDFKDDESYDAKMKQKEEK